jgi:hypothetical protein
VIISHIVGGKVLAVNFTSFEHYPTSTCPVAVGDHECISKASVVYYPRFMEIEAKNMGLVLARGEGVSHCKDVTSDLLKRIKHGMAICPDVREAIKEKYGIIPPKPSRPAF